MSSDSTKAIFDKFRERLYTVTTKWYDVGQDHNDYSQIDIVSYNYIISVPFHLFNLEFKKK